MDIIGVQVVDFLIQCNFIFFRRLIWFYLFFCGTNKILRFESEKEMRYTVDENFATMLDVGWEFRLNLAISPERKDWSSNGELLRVVQRGYLVTPRVASGGKDSLPAPVDTESQHGVCTLSKRYERANSLSCSSRAKFKDLYFLVFWARCATRISPPCVPAPV